MPRRAPEDGASAKEHAEGEVRERGCARAAEEQAIRASRRAAISAAVEEQQQRGSEQRAGRGTEQRQRQQSGEHEARDAADEMQRAAQSMQDARQAQVTDWKKELTSELDQSVQEMMQLARQERALEQQARGGVAAERNNRRARESRAERGGAGRGQGERAAAGRGEEERAPLAALAARDVRSEGQGPAGDAEHVARAGQPVAAGGRAGRGRRCADEGGRVARARPRAREQREQRLGLQRDDPADAGDGAEAGTDQLAGAGADGHAAGRRAAAQGQSLARQLAQQQRSIADQLEDAGDAAGGDRAAQLAREARQLADALDNGRLDATTLARQQQLFRRLLDAGRSLEKDEREDSGKREATSATGTETFTPTGRVDTNAAMKFRPPTWQELRGLSADERRAILDYFTRINSAPAPVVDGASSGWSPHWCSPRAGPRPPARGRRAGTAGAGRQHESPEVSRALELENTGNFREACADLPPGDAHAAHADVVLGLERSTPSSG